MSKKVHIVDYGLGNLFSVSNAFRKIGANPIIIDNPKDIKNIDFLVLPGVGGFKQGMHELETRGFKDEIIEYASEGKFLLGICLGMQMLFESSEENGFSAGLGLIPGTIDRIDVNYSDIKVPHIGWGKLKSINNKLSEVIDQKYMYFVHSYHPTATFDSCVASTNYNGVEITAVVNKGNIWGCQFHPEKSGESGLNLLAKMLALKF